MPDKSSGGKGEQVRVRPVEGVRDFYDNAVEMEWGRLERHPMEFRITWRTLEEYLQPGSHIADVGGGPGRYAVALASEGHKVSLIDLSPENIAWAQRLAAEQEVELENALVRDARQLDGLGSEAFDAVLLLGPLYHLQEEVDRRKAVSEALRLLRPGGLLFAAFITRFAPVVDILRRDPMEILEAPDGLTEILNTGCFVPDSDDDGFTYAYFADPWDVQPWMESCGLKTLRIIAAEGFIAMVADKVNNLPPEAFEIWVDFCYRWGTEPSAWGTAEHLLYVGQKGVG